MSVYIALSLLQYVDFTNMERNSGITTAYQMVCLCMVSSENTWKSCHLGDVVSTIGRTTNNHIMLPKQFSECDSGTPMSLEEHHQVGMWTIHMDVKGFPYNMDMHDSLVTLSSKWKWLKWNSHIYMYIYILYFAANPIDDLSFVAQPMLGSHIDIKSPFTLSQHPISNPWPAWSKCCWVRDRSCRQSSPSVHQLRNFWTEGIWAKCKTMKQSDVSLSCKHNLTKCMYKDVIMNHFTDFTLLTFDMYMIPRITTHTHTNTHTMAKATSRDWTTYSPRSRSASRRCTSSQSKNFRTKSMEHRVVTRRTRFFVFHASESLEESTWTRKGATLFQEATLYNILWIIGHDRACSVLVQIVLDVWSSICWYSGELAAATAVRLRQFPENWVSTTHTFMYINQHVFLEQSINSKETHMSHIHTYMFH